MYGGAFQLFDSELPRRGIRVTLIESTEAADFVEAMTERTKLVWFEVCSNPLLKVLDLKTTIEGIKAANADVVVGVDNTFLTPYIVVSYDHLLKLFKRF